MEKVKVSLLLSNPNNPRVIKDDKFKKLVNSIKDIPEMLEARPVVVNPDMVVLGGNMRLKALREAGVKEAPVYIASWDEIKQKRFIITDNVGYGEWDWDILANEWDAEELGIWGLDVWQPEADVDYSILDDEDVSGQLEDMTNGVKKAIQIEFEAEHYEEAYGLVKFWREQGGYVGGMIMEYLKSEKEKI